MNKKMYVLVRSELSKSQRIPQACHAVAEFMGEFGQDPEVQDWLENDRTMICLHCDEETMGNIMDVAWKEKLPYKAFIDDDFSEDFGWAAVAFHPSFSTKWFEFLRLA